MVERTPEAFRLHARGSRKDREQLLETLILAATSSSQPNLHKLNVHILLDTLADAARGKPLDPETCQTIESIAQEYDHKDFTAEDVLALYNCGKQPTGDWKALQEKVFDWASNHGVTLVNSEINDLIHIVEAALAPQPVAAQGDSVGLASAKLIAFMSGLNANGDYPELATRICALLDAIERAATKPDDKAKIAVREIYDQFGAVEGSKVLAFLQSYGGIVKGDA